MATYKKDELISFPFIFHMNDILIKFDCQIHDTAILFANYHSLHPLDKAKINPCKSRSKGNRRNTTSMTFYDGGKTLGTGNLSGDGHATFSISSLSKGTHSITAAYTGDDNFDGSSSSAFSQVIK
jgi:hypothetical protein